MRRQPGFDRGLGTKKSNPVMAARIGSTERRRPGDGGSAYVTPADLEGMTLAARLVVLSACETVGVNRFDFDNRLAFVTQLLRQSEALVVASLWPVSDGVTASLMADF